MNILLKDLTRLCLFILWLMILIASIVFIPFYMFHSGLKEYGKDLISHFSLLK